VKATAKLKDASLNRAIRLIGEGEHHYRIATGRLASPADWRRRVVDWAAEVATLGTDELVMVKLAPPSPQQIVININQLSGYVEAATGVRIPTDEFERDDRKG
jgi:hypothetical protein